MPRMKIESPTGVVHYYWPRTRYTLCHAAIDGRWIDCDPVIDEFVGCSNCARIVKHESRLPAEVDENANQA